jgi:hypothetical protein
MSEPSQNMPVETPAAPSQPTVTIPPPGPSNPAGFWGFVLSLLGLVACGLPSPIGLVVSAIGLRRQPKLLAVVGVVLGLLGTLGWGITAILVAQGASKAATMLGDALPASMEMNSDAVAIRDACAKFKAERGVMPGSLDSIDVDEDARIDRWGTRYRFELTSGDGFILISDGPDRLTDTSDDMRTRSSELQGP